MEPQFIISLKKSLADEKIDITLENLPVNRSIKIVVQSNDFYCINALPDTGVGSLWASTVVYKSSREGKIDFGQDAPVSAKYDGIEPMGLLETITPLEKKPAEKTTKLENIPLNKLYHITLQAFCNDELLCESMIERIFQSDDVVSQDIDSDNLVARYFTRKNSTAKPAIIVVSGSDGRIEKAQNIAQLFASHGFSSLAVCYFGLENVPNELNQIPMEYIQNAICFLQQQPEVDSSKIGIYGRSKGGEMALLAGSLFPNISCVIANTPCIYVMEGLNSKNRNSKSSSWSFKNTPLPYVSFSYKAFLKYILKKLCFKKATVKELYSSILKSTATYDAQIHIENINGSILIISAEKDEIWPSSVFGDRAVDYLKEKQFPYPVIHRKYKNAGHFLTIAYQPNPRYSLNTSESILKDEKNSWKETLLFLEQWTK